ncbi:MULTISPECIES: hypothetical protein [Streptomyces]|uniref:hypothetical protein n=1 Tax=Streptomyces TaxID=1883 RepID=UPI001E58CFA3|nr:hypothetical protein [Streptomyces galilaeus]
MADTSWPRDKSAATGATAVARDFPAVFATTAVVPLAVSATETAETISTLLIRFMP